MRIALALILLAVIAVVVGTMTGSPSTSDALRLGIGGEPQTLDPHRYNLRIEETLLNDLFMGLTTFDAQGRIAPGSAKRWQISDDGLTWTFWLHEGLTWSDGHPLTAADFVYALRRLQDPQTAASLAYFMYMLKNAAAINAGELPVEQLGTHAADDHTLVLELEAPYPYLLERLLYPTAFPVPRHAIEAHGDAWTKPANWVSNGAYTLGAWRPQAHLELRANPRAASSVAIDQVFYHPVTNEQSAYNRFRNGELHAIGSFPVGELDTARDKHADALRVSDLLSMMYLVFNTEHEALADVRVREALALAIDQSVLTDKVLRSGAKPAVSFVPWLVEDYEPAPYPHSTLATDARLTRARQLLADAGYGDDSPLELTLRHVVGLENKKVNLAITGMWRNIGVRAELHQAELRTHFADLRRGDFEVAWAGWVGENNAEHYLTLLQSTIGGVNYGRFSDPDVDRWLASAQTQADRATRNAHLREAELASLARFPVIPLYTNAVRRLVDPRLTGWHDNPRDMHQVRHLSWQRPD